MKTGETLESYAHKLYGGETSKREVEEGLSPFMAVGHKEVCRPPRVAKEVAGHKEEEEEEKGR